jgi:hypothetical protein
VTLRPLADGKVRLALDYVREPRALEPGEARNLALSLSQQQARMLAEVRDAGNRGAELPGNHGGRTMDTLVRHGLVWESDVRGRFLCLLPRPLQADRCRVAGACAPRAEVDRVNADPIDR